MNEVETPEQHNQFIAEVGPVLSMSRVPNITYGHERYFDFMSQFYLHANSIPWDDYGLGRGAVTQVLLRMGDPNSGKTFIGNSTRNAILPRLSGLPLFQGNGYEKYVIRRNWEDHGEQRARDKGLIDTPVDEAYTREELNFAEDELMDSIFEAIGDRRSVAVEVELPGGIAALVDGVMKTYRPLGARVVRQLVKRQGVFSNLNYEVWGAAFVGGPFLRVLRYGRERVRRARSLKEAESYAHLYGMIKKDASLSPEYWETLKNGAYMKQMPVIDEAIRELMVDISETAEIKNAKAIAGQYPHDELTQLIVSQSGIDYLHPWIQGARWQQFLEGQESVGLNSDRAIIAYYNPTPSQLGMTRTDVYRIQQDMAQAA